MRIALLTNIVAPYRRTAWSTLHRRACAQGGALHVICTHRTEAQRNWPAIPGTFPQTTLRGISVPLRENRALRLTTGIGRSLSNIRPDVVILTGFSPAMRAAQRWARKRYIPTIVQFDGWSGSDGAYHNPLRGFLRRDILTHAASGIAACQRGTAWFAQHRMAKDTIHVAPIPLSFAPPASLPGFEGRTYDLLWCGRTTRQKGFDDFLTIARHLHDAGRIGTIAVIGSLDQGRVSRQVDDHGLGTITDIFPQLPPDALPELLTRARLCLFPSFNDAYGLGVIEAIACGAVALASDGVGCAPDVLDRSEILPSGHPAHWCDACHVLLANPVRWEQARARQKARIQDNTPDHHAGTLWSVANAALPSAMVDE